MELVSTGRLPAHPGRAERCVRQVLPVEKRALLTAPLAVPLSAVREAGPPHPEACATHRPAEAPFTPDDERTRGPAFADGGKAIDPPHGRTHTGHHASARAGRRSSVTSPDLGVGGSSPSRRLGVDSSDG
ncbi:MAG: hypothetical protein AVDCRST_MAG32-2467 [uncultured Nocardioides sp.]|uniref:Uncharacterized protein n=1 Tax=uncultured Nocardioides sp. TaxID=198441 RepID=A0A6J4NRN9_9ACTN|nr:MAG: hypothetical protein AVDCRST_MAG32-2467 [uncultured Nocardioides sp.]